MDFKDFLSNFIQFEGITNSKLAEILEVPAATISHLLSGRNKPSLDFIQKLIKNYPHLDLYHLLNIEKPTPSIKSQLEENISPPPTPSKSSSKKIKKIVLFYDDNSFEEYNT